MFKQTAHPYTEGLFGSIPKLNEEVTRLNPIEGLMPDPMNLPSGCKFWPRCKYADERCRKEVPEMVSLGGPHSAKCFRAGKEGNDGEE